MASLLERNDISLVNNIIYKIYSIEDITEMRIAFLGLLKILIPYFEASFYLASKDSAHILDNPVGVNISGEALQRYLDGYEDKDYTRWFFLSAKNMAYRETDLFSEGCRVNKEYYKELYYPANIHYSAQLCLSYYGTFVGVVSLYRSRGEEDFTDDQIFLLDLFKEHLAYRLYHKNIVPDGEKIYFDRIEKIRKKFELTNRETEVLQRLFEGYSTEVLANELNISAHTLKKHICNIYKKTGVKTRLELFRNLNG